MASPVEGVVLDLIHEPADVAAIVPLPQPRPRSTNPYWVYLARLRSDTSRTTMQGHLDRLAHLVTGQPLPRKAKYEPRRPSDPKDTPRRKIQGAIPATIRGDVIPWDHLRRAHTATIASMVAAQGWSPSYVNSHLVALAQVMKEAWLLGLLDGESYHRAVIGLEKDRGQREQAGRHVDRREIAAHLDACLARVRDPQTGEEKATVKGVRDAAVIAVATATGARRAELVAADLADLDGTEGLLLKGKGNKQRRIPLAEWVMPYLNAWLRIRGTRQSGPLFTRTDRWDRVTQERLSGQTIADILADRTAQAGTAACTPHDYRRAFVSALLDDPQNDLVTVQKLAGHESPQTTSRYDRRGIRARKAAIDRLPDPHVGPTEVAAPI